MDSNDKIWLRDIEHEMLQVSIEMSKLRGLSSIGNNLSSGAPYLHTARRPEERQTNSRCRLLLESKPLELPFYKGEVKAIQTETLHQSCTALNISSQSGMQSVQLKPNLSKSRKSKVDALGFKVKALVKKNSTKMSVRVVPQRNKSAESESRCESIPTRKEIAKDVVEHNIFPEDQQATEPPPSKNGGPIYKVLAVSSDCQIQGEKKLPNIILNINQTENSKK